MDSTGTDKDLEVKILKAKVFLLEKIADSYRSICSNVSYRPFHLQESIKSVRKQLGEEGSADLSKIEMFLADLVSEDKWKNFDPRIGERQDEIEKNQEFLRLIS